MTDKRYKEIIKQLLKIIHALCKEHGKDSAAVIEECTNMTQEEMDILNICNTENKK